MSDVVFDRMLFDHLDKVTDQTNRIAALEEEISRLRLTDAEREAVERACCSLGGVVDMSAECTEWDADARLTLLSLLERLA